MSTFVFLFTCASFACHGVPLHGNGIYYQTKTACHRAAQQHAARHRISLGRYEIACVERDKAGDSRK